MSRHHSVGNAPSPLVLISKELAPSAGPSPQQFVETTNPLFTGTDPMPEAAMLTGKLGGSTAPPPHRRSRMFPSSTFACCEERAETRQEIDNAEPSLRSELIRFANLSSPSSATMFLMYLQQTLTFSLTSRTLGTDAFGGVSLGLLVGNLSGFMLVYGILTAVDTLAPQTFAAGNHAEVGILTLRGIFVVFSTFPFTIAIWLNAETILIAIGQPAVQAALAAQFLRVYLIGLPGLCLWESARRFMWSQNVSQWPFVGFAAVALGWHIGVLIIGLPQMGFAATALAHTTTNWIMVAQYLIWVKVFKPHHPDTWVFPVAPSVLFDRTAMRVFFNLAVPGVASMAEWFFFEFFVFLSGEISAVALAANSICYNLIPICFTIPSGLSIGICARVGALLAQGRVKSARSLSDRVLILACVLGVAVAVLVGGFRDLIISGFSSDEEVNALARTIWPLLCFFLFLDSVFGGQAGVLRALAMQFYFSVMVFCCLFVIGLPGIAALAFSWGANLGLTGLWWGMPFAYVLLNLVMFLAHRRKDWQAYSAYIVDREAKVRARDEALQQTVVHEGA